MAMTLYTIKRYYKSGRKSVIATGQTIEACREWCSRKDTHKNDKNGNTIWFDGFTKQ